MSEWSIQDLVNHFKCLGLDEGDTVLIRASSKKVGNIKGPGSTAEKILEALLTTVTDKGTIVALAFTKSFIFPQKKIEHLFQRVTPSLSGGLANALIFRPDSLRSRHPTNSFVAIGKHADYILQGHDELAACFYPMEKLIELNAKMLLVGCVEDSPGFSTVHLVQNHLNLSTKTILKNMTGACYLMSDGKMGLFRKRDIPGCSDGFYKFYSYYIKKEKLLTGNIGNAYAVLIRARDAYDIEHSILSKNPKFALCDNKNCALCRGGYFYNISDWPSYYLRKFPTLLKIIVSKIN